MSRAFWFPWSQALTLPYLCICVSYFTYRYLKYSYERFVDCYSQRVKDNSEVKFKESNWVECLGSCIRLHRNRILKGAFPERVLYVESLSQCVGSCLTASPSGYCDRVTFQINGRCLLFEHKIPQIFAGDSERLVRRNGAVFASLKIDCLYRNFMKCKSSGFTCALEIAGIYITWVECNRNNRRIVANSRHRRSDEKRREPPAPPPVTPAGPPAPPPPAGK